MVPSPDTFARAPPSLQWVPWPPLAGAPAVPHPHRYYEVLRLLSIHPVASSLPWRFGTSHGKEEMKSSLRFLGHPCGACLGLETPASLRDLAITVAARYCLPLAQTRWPRNDT